MKRSLKLIITALVMALSIVLLSSFIASAAASNVVYISANGTGDGSSPNSPLGNTAGYTPGNKKETDNAFYRGLDKLKSTGGTLVIVGDVIIDSVESRFTDARSPAVAPSEFRTPKFTSGVSLTVTSVYNGVDYRNNGARLIFDYDTCNTTAFAFGCSATIENINILYKYYEGGNNSWNTPFMLCGGGYNFTIGDNVEVSSLNTKTNAPGDQYPMIVGGHRYAVINRSYFLTVNSGTWSTVIAGSCGINNLVSYGAVNGNVSLNISGGKIGQVVGTGHISQPSNTINGTLGLTVSGGEIGEMYVVHPIEYTGKSITVNILKNAKIGSFYYAPDNYAGFIDDLVSKINLKNTSSLVIPDLIVDVTPEEDTPADTLPPQTAAPEAETQAPESSSNSDTSYAEDDGPVIPTIVWVMLAVAAVIIGGSSYLINRIKLNILNK